MMADDTPDDDAPYDQAWVDALVASVPAEPIPGLADALRVLYVITDAPDGKFAFFLDLASGVVTNGTAGRLPRGEKAGITITVKEPILLLLWSGELSRDTAFMAGDIKVEGAYEVWLDQLVPAFENEAWSSTWAAARPN